MVLRSILEQSFQEPFVLFYLVPNGKSLLILDRYAFRTVEVAGHCL